MILDVAIYLFVALELANVMLMYFKPDFRYGNSMSVFTAWERAQTDKQQKLFVDYLVRWVANCKVIFIALLLMIALFASQSLKFWAVIATIVAMGLYFVTLHPIIKQLDAQGDIRPKGYSRTLAINILAFQAMFAAAALLHLLQLGDL